MRELAGRLRRRPTWLLALLVAGASLLRPGLRGPTPPRSSSVAKSLSQWSRRLSFPARAGATAPGLPPLNYLTAARQDVGLMIGFGDHAFYAKSACPTQDPPPAPGEDCTGAPPYEGLVGSIVGIVNLVPDMIASAGIASCADIPASGSATVTNSVGDFSLIFSAPTHSVPSTWSDGGAAFGKRVAFAATIGTGLPLKAAYEFSCGKPSGFVAVNMAVGSHAPGSERRINIFFGELSGQRATDVYFSEYDPSSQETRGIAAVALRVNEATSQFDMWNIRTNSPGAVQSVDKIIVHGDYAAKKASIFFKRINSQANMGSLAYSVPALAAIGAEATDASIETTTQFDFDRVWCQATSMSSSGFPMCDESQPDQQVGTVTEKQGCIDMNNPDLVLTSAALCPGLALSAGSTPVIDPSGSFTPLWAVGSMSQLLDVAGIEL